MYIVYAIIAFSILIIIHELGHFTMAKLNNVKVEEFSLGMGPKIVGFQGKETLYMIKAFPIGGYVKMLGEQEEASNPDDPRAYNNKSPLQKLSIIIAGPLMNLFLGIVLFAMIASFKGYAAPVISDLVPGQPAQAAGLQQGDELLKVNGKNILTWEEFVTDIYSSGGKSLEITYIRNGAESTAKITPVMDKELNRYIVGIYPTVVTSPDILHSAKYGVVESWSLVKQTFGFLGTLVTGRASMNDFGGPVTIIKYTGEAAKAGILVLMNFAAYISIQLAIFNIIPFPALDGGFILLYLFETITGKRVDEKKVGLISYIGLTILLALMVLVTIKDILYPINM
jgi:regulator of sigma E protease